MMEYDYEDYSDYEKVYDDDDVLIDEPIPAPEPRATASCRMVHADTYTALIDLLKDLYVNCDRLEWLTDEQHELYSRLTSEDGE